MNENLLIVGAGIYGRVAKEIAKSMRCFDKIAFLDDGEKNPSESTEIVGTSGELKQLAKEYRNVVVAIGNPEIRLSMLKKIEAETDCKIATLISPYAYISPSATVMKGSIIEPMAVVHTQAVISVGCIISAGAVVNHASVCSEGVHVDCNATVAGMVTVPAKMKIGSGKAYW